MKARIPILLACCLLTCHVRTFAVNVDVEFVDASSASGDKYVSRNVDDDDKNEQWDKDQNEGQMLTEQPAEPENDLKKFKVTTSIENGTLSISVDTYHTSNVRFWADEKKEKLHKKSWAVTGGNIINAQDAPAHSDGTEGYFWVEGLVNSASLNDIEIKAKIGDEEDPVKISVIEVDLDVDSDNENGFEASGFTDAEDKIETSDEDEHPGKIVIFSPSANSDGDQVPDFADGFKLKSPSEFASCANLEFVPLRVDLKTPFDPQNAKVSFHYEKMSKPKLDGDDAGLSVSGTGTSEDPYVFTVLKGGMRLWNKKATERTSGNTVADDGNFIPVDEEIEWSKIEESSGSRTGWVYLEYMDKDTPEYSGKKEIKVTAKQTVGATLEASDTVNVYFPQVELDVNGDGDLDDSCDDLATYMPGYELFTAKLHTGTSFENSQYAGPQSMNIIIDNLPSSMADEAHVRIVAASNWYGYCGNGSIANDSPILSYKDFSLDGQETVSTTQEATGSSSGNKMVIPIYCHDYGGWCEVEITLKKNGATIGSPIKLTLPHDGNGDRLADSWQIQQINNWNAQYGESLDNSAENLATTWATLDGDKEKVDPDGSGSLHPHASVGDGLEVLKEYRGFIVDGGEGNTAGYKRLSAARKEVLIENSEMADIQNAISNGTNPSAVYDLAGVMTSVCDFYENGFGIHLYYAVDAIVAPVNITADPATSSFSQVNYNLGGPNYLYGDEELAANDAAAHNANYEMFQGAYKPHGFQDSRHANYLGLSDFVRFRLNSRDIWRRKDSSGSYINWKYGSSNATWDTSTSKGARIQVAAVAEEGGNFSDIFAYTIAHELCHLLSPNSGGHDGGSTASALMSSSTVIVNTLSGISVSTGDASGVSLPTRRSTQ